MARTIIVELTTEQVQQMVADARVIYPEATNAELEAKVDEAATIGVYDLAGQWRMLRVQHFENVNRATEQAEHDALFPTPEALIPPPM